MAVISAAFIILLVWFVTYRRRTNAKLRELEERFSGSELGGEETPQLPGQLPIEISAAERRAEVRGVGRHELPDGLVRDY